MKQGHTDLLRAKGSELGRTRCLLALGLSLIKHLQCVRFNFGVATATFHRTGLSPDSPRFGTA